jgi:large subunit ribosomal protein L6
MPVTIPQDVKVEVKGSQVSVKGPKGELSRVIPAAMDVSIEDGKLLVSRSSDEPEERALHGLTRTLIDNMVVGVSAGFQKVLEVNGVGYRAEMNGEDLVLHVGFSHKVTIEPPVGISFEVDARTRQIKVLGYDKEMVGQVAANIR